MTPTQEQIIAKLNEVIEVLNDQEIPPVPIDLLDEEERSTFSKIREKGAFPKAEDIHPPKKAPRKR